MPGQVLAYNPTLEAWAAFDVDRYRSEQLVCGQRVILLFADGQALTVRAWDAGRFGGRWVNTFGPNVPIVVDLPEHLKPDRRGSWAVVAMWAIGDNVGHAGGSECHQLAIGLK